MPAQALQRQKYTEYELPQEVVRAIDACRDPTAGGKSKLKEYLRQNGVQSIAEMDYTLRQAYSEYLTYHEQLAHPAKYILLYDRVKQEYIGEQIQTLQGRFEWEWRYENAVMFLPYHPNAYIARSFDTVRHQANMVWDFTIPCSQTLKEQIFLTLTDIVEKPLNSTARRHKLSGLQMLYGFCVDNNISDIELMDSYQERQFAQYLTEQTNTESQKAALYPILNQCRKTIFVQSKTINWNATVWYLERLQLAPHRLNESNLPQAVSFKDIIATENRRYAQEFMRYQLGITGQAVSTILGRYKRVQHLLCYLSDKGLNVCDCNADIMEQYIAEIDKQNIIPKTFNDYLSALAIFFRFMIVKDYIKRMPFYPEYYQKKIIPQHHNRSVSPDVCMEILQNIHKLPEHTRCMYLHLWCLGLRISEVCTLKGDAYYRQGEDTWIKVYQVKMKNYKHIPISEGLYRIMQVYIKRNNIQPDEYLFKNHKGNAYNSGTFRYQMIKFCENQNIEGGDYLFRSHDYRHTVATHLYDNGVSLQGVRDYLGHNYEEMTQQYIDYIPRKIAKESTEFFSKPSNNLASCLEKGGKK